MGDCLKTIFRKYDEFYLGIIRSFLIYVLEIFRVIFERLFECYFIY